MKKIILILLLIPFLVRAQTAPPIVQGSKLYQFRNGIKIDSALFLPRRDTTNSDATMLAPGMIQWNPVDKKFYGRDSTKWITFITSLTGESIDSAYRSNDTLFLRYASGGELAVKMDYYTKGESDSRYPILDSLYNRLDTLNNWLVSGPAPSYMGYSHASDGFVDNLGGDTLINVFRIDDDLTHVSNAGRIVKRYSYDGGLTWSDTAMIFNSQYDDRNISGGVTSTGRIVVFFRQFNNSISQNVTTGYITSTDRGNTWSSFTQVSTATTGAPYGAMVRNGAGTYIILRYTSNFCEKFVSTDNGATWSNGGTVYDFTVSNPSRMVTEPTPVYIGNNRLIILARNENLIGGPFYQLNSTNDGTTWTWQGNTNIGGDTLSRTAPYIVYDQTRNTVIAFGCQRHIYSNGFTNNFRDNKNDSLVWYINHPDDVFNTPTGYTMKGAFPRPEPDIRYFYGYPRGCQLDNGNWLFIFGEETALGDPDNTSGKLAHLWQFDLSYMRSYYDMDSCRYGGLVKQFNVLTGKYDNVITYGQWVRRADSVMINRANATIKIVPPMWSDSAIALQVVGRNDNAAKVNILGNGFTDFSDRIKIRGGSPGLNEVLTDIDGTGQAEWRANDLQRVTGNGNWTDNGLISYGNIFARYYKFINSVGTAEPVSSPFFRFNDTTYRWLWGNANRSAATLDTLGNAVTTGYVSPSYLWFQNNTTSTDYAIGKESNHLWMGIPANSANGFRVYGGSNTLMRLDGTANLSIGTATPIINSGYTSLTINNNTTGAIISMQANGVDIGRTTVNGTNVLFGSMTNVPLGFRTNSTVRMQISSTGEVSVGSTSSPATFYVNGSVATAIRTATSTTTLTAADATLIMDNTGGAATVNLPAASTCAGRVYVVKKTTGSSLDVTIDPSGAEQIDNQPTYVLSSLGNVAVIQSSGTAWYVIGH